MINIGGVSVTHTQLQTMIADKTTMMHSMVVGNPDLQNEFEELDWLKTKLSEFHQSQYAMRSQTARVQASRLN